MKFSFERNDKIKMENKYIYRKHLREPGKFFLTMGLFYVIVYTICSLTLILSGRSKDKFTEVIIVLVAGIVIAAFLSLELLIIYFVMYRRFKKIYVILTDEVLIYNNAKGEIRIPYENINALKFPSVKYAGGWLKIVHTNGNIRLTVVLENIGDMVKELKSKLDERNLSVAYKEKPMYNFFKTAKYSDYSWERVYENIKFLIISVATNLIVGAIFTLLITNIGVKIVVLVASVVGPAIAFIISEIINGKKLAKGASKEDFSVPDRDKLFEKKVNNWVFGIYAIIYLVGLVIVYLKY